MLKEHEVLRQTYNKNVEELEEGTRLEKEYNEWLEMKARDGDLFSESSSETGMSELGEREEFVIKVNGKSMPTLRQNVAMAANEIRHSVKNILRKFRADPATTTAVIGKELKLGVSKTHSHIP